MNPVKQNVIQLTKWLCLQVVMIMTLQAANPSLTQPGVIEQVKSSTFPDQETAYQQAYNLGATGLRGWIYVDSKDAGYDGNITAKSIEILVSAVGANTPASGIIAVDDVILGANSSASDPVVDFDDDCRHQFGKALGGAEISGTLRLKRWRKGVATTEVNITIPKLGAYTSTAPYNCPKSAKILEGARKHMVAQLLADPEFLTRKADYANPISALALLAGVEPSSENYGQVRIRLRDYARSLTPPDLVLYGCDTWGWSYTSIFLNEYYLRIVEDSKTDPGFFNPALIAHILAGANKYSVALAKAQGQYGTFGHGGSELNPNGGLHGPVPSYGTINCSGLAANIGIALGKKVMEVSGKGVDPEIAPAVERASNFFGYYVDKGSIPYGEHLPWVENAHCSNGKDQMCAVFFGLQPNRAVEAEYFARMSVAGYRGIEYGHTGQGFSHLWSALGANAGGEIAMAKYMENTRWLHDLKRRTNGSFVYEGGEQYSAGATINNDYLGDTADVNYEEYEDLNPTAFYLLAYSVPLKRLYITGRNSIHSLSAAKVDDSIAAAKVRKACPGYTTTQLMNKLADYDPIVRYDVAETLSSRPLSTTEVNTLVQAITGTNPVNEARLRMGACQVLGNRQVNQAIPALRQRLTDTNLWVRAKAAIALKEFGTGADSQRVEMLNAFIANAQDADVIDWADPIHFSNGYLAEAIFEVDGPRRQSLRNLNKNLAFAALEKGLREPSNTVRSVLGEFVNELTLEDIKKLAPALVKAAKEGAPGDRMNPGEIRNWVTGLLARYKIDDGIPLCLMLKEQRWHGDYMNPFDWLQSYGSGAKDALPTLKKWEAHLPDFLADPSIWSVDGRYAAIQKGIKDTIAVIEGDTSPPQLVNFKTLTVSATPVVNGLTKASTTLHADMTDIDGGVGMVSWSKLSGPGQVVFQPGKRTLNADTSASFSAAGTYVLRATMVDSSILNEQLWVTRNLGYYDFKTYEQNAGAVVKDITVTVASPELPGIPVSSGLVLQLDASQISNAIDGSQLNLWEDTSGAGNNAIRQNGSSSGYPKFITNGINGLPVVRFDSGSANTGDFMKFTRISTIRSVFWVLKENSGATDTHSLLGDSDGFDFHRGSTRNGPLWDPIHTSSQVRNGTTKLMGGVIDGTTTPLPSASFQVVSLVTAGNASANQVCQDRSFHGSWQGDIAEILIYDRPLTASEEERVGTYLSEKYGITTAYKALPVDNGLVLRMDASQITGIANDTQVNTWMDTSGLSNHAVRQSGSSAGFPKFIVTGVGGRPVVRFSSNSQEAGDYLKFNRISDIRTVFWVIKENTGLTDSHFLLGDDVSYDFHRGASNGSLWTSSYTHENIRNGITRLMGNTINGTSTSLPADSFQLVSLVTAGNVQANQICQDRTFHGSWQGDIAEVLIYNRALTGTEQARVGTYLANKYQLITSYPTTAASTVPAAVAAVADNTGKVRVTWTQVPGAMSYNVWTRNTQTGTERVVTNDLPPCEITGLTAGTRYEFKVSSVYPSAVSGSYSSLVSATPNVSGGYAAWASVPNHGFTTANNGPMDDPDHDGACNLMEFVLGGSPMASSAAILPTLNQVGDRWVFEYSRSNLSQFTTTQIVEYSSDLIHWTQIEILANSSNGVEIQNGNIKVTIPRVEGKPNFTRLKVFQ